MQTAKVDLKNQPLSSDGETDYKMDTETRTWATSTVAGHLAELGPYLDKKYLSCEVLTEADIQFLTVSFLKRLLLKEDGFWYIGAENYVGKNRQRPDTVCYYYKGSRSSRDIVAPKEFFDHETRNEMIVCIIEIKFATRKNDLKKLELPQDKLSNNGKREILVWHIFGDHFNSNIHKKNARVLCDIEDETIELENALNKWKNESKFSSPKLRGFTLLKFGLHGPGPVEIEDFNQREFMNRHFWILDPQSFYKQRKDGDKIKTLKEQEYSDYLVEKKAHLDL
jgi:hypothetical protein